MDTIKSMQLKNIQLVTTVREYPCLYDRMSINYARRDVTEQAWMDIAEKLNSPVPLCKDKWKNIRLVYRRHLKDELESKIRKPYYLMEFMEFMKPIVKYQIENPQLPAKRTRANSGELTNNDEETRDEVDQSVQSDSIRLIESINQSTSPTHKDVNNMFENNPYRYLGADNPNRQFLLSLVPELDEMNTVQVKKFKRRVFKLIDDIMSEGPNMKAEPEVFGASESMPNEDSMATLKEEHSDYECPIDFT